MNSAPEALPDNVAALRATLVAAWAEREAEHAEKLHLVAERDQHAVQNEMAEKMPPIDSPAEQGRATVPLQPPAVTHPALAAEAGLVFEPHLQTLFGMRAHWRRQRFDIARSPRSSPAPALLTPMNGYPPGSAAERMHE